MTANWVNSGVVAMARSWNTCRAIAILEEGSLAVEWGQEKPHQRQYFGAFCLEAILRNQAAARSAGTLYGITT